MHEETEQPICYDVDPRTLMFLFGELPFITHLHERARSELENDDNVQIEGVKELLLAARDSYKADLGKRSRQVTPLMLSKCLQYTRNLIADSPSDDAGSDHNHHSRTTDSWRRVRVARCRTCQ